MVFHWDWAKLCGRSDSNFTIWDKGDFGHCFEQLVILTPTHVLLAIISIYHIIKHRNRQTIGRIPHSPTLYIRFGITLALCLTPLILLLLWYVYEKLHPSLIDILSWIVRAVTWLLHSAFVWRLRRHYHIHIRGPVSVVLSFLLATASIIVQLRTVIRHIQHDTSFFSKAEEIITFIVSALHLLYTASLVPSKRPDLSQYISAYQPINESTERDVEERFSSYGSITRTRADLGPGEAGASIFSKLTFWWVNPLLLRGHKENITKTADLFELPPRLDTKSIDESFSKTFRAKRQHKYSDQPISSQNDINPQVGFSSDSSRVPKSISILRALNTTFGCEYYSLGILKFFGDGLGFAGPLLLNVLVKYMQNPNEPSWHGYLYAGGLFASTLLSSLFTTHFNYQVSVVGLKVRAALIAAIYKKSLKISIASKSKTSTGEIVNHMSTDTDRIVNFCPTFHAFWSLPVQTAVALYLLYSQVGWAFLAGLGFTILLIPINKWLANKIGQLSRDLMERKDARVKVMNEILYGIRVIKMYAWEKHFTERIGTLRDSELESLKGRKYLDALCVYFWATTPVLISILTFTTYALMGHELTAAKVFTSMALFTMLIMPLNAFPWVINGMVESWVSVNRLSKFLEVEELDWDNYYATIRGDTASVVKVEDGCFSWGDIPVAENGQNHGFDQESRTQPSRNGLLINEEDDSDSDNRSKIIGTLKLQNVDLDIHKGMLVGIVGKVGSGKSSLLDALLGEMILEGGSVAVKDLSEGFGLASQEAWIQHATVRDNILFGLPYFIDKYEAILEVCALNEDLKILPSGDLTEIGENGITLSGGQKARVSLARAVYQDKDIYLLDDPLAAVDAHVAKHLFEQCIMGQLGNKTRILCTHHVNYLKDADIVIMMEKGRIKQYGSPKIVLQHLDKELLTEGKPQAAGSSESMGIPDVDDDVIQDDAGLVQEEEMESGVVKMHVYRSYWLAVGNCLAPLVLISLLLMQASRNITDWWLSYWVTHSHGSHNSSSTNNSFDLMDATMTHQYNLYIPLQTSPWTNITDAEDNIKFYLTVYGSLAAANSVFTFARAFLFAYGGICAATKVHNALLGSILKAPVGFFDVTPIGRILNRFSSDVYSVDDSLPFIMNVFFAQSYGVLGTLVITCYGLPWFILLLVPLAVIYYFIQKYYRQSSREIKRITSVTLSPVYAHFTETLNGLATIRAMRQIERFEVENRVRLDENQRAQFAGLAANQWLAIRLQMIGIAMVTGIALIAVLEHHFHEVNAGLVGLALSYALSVTFMLSGVVMSFTETEKQMVSMERASQYTEDVPQERQWATLTAPPYWPIQGSILFQNVCLQYRPGQPLALKNVTFETQPAEKIGIVGRTGSGKSSLFQVLFRMVDILSGHIHIDGINVQHVSLEELRSRLAVIPQDPFLFCGTVRENLDPTNTYADHEVWDVLESCHMREAISDLGGLHVEVGERGCRLSVGQRQLMCLARALLTHAKVLCIDEATASVDQETDSIIQATIRSEFRDQTVLTIAHRINTVLDSDRVLVMQHGQVAEFAPPDVLLKNPNSLFYGFVHGHNHEMGALSE